MIIKKYILRGRRTLIKVEMLMVIGDFKLKNIDYIWCSIILMEGGKINFDIDTSESQGANTFLLKRLNVASNSPSVEVDFSPIQSEGEQHSCNQIWHSFPVFNFDSTYFTPAFILDLDKQKYVDNASSYLTLHESKIEELSIEKTELFVARPSRSNSYCCICKTAFEDYLTHVNIPRHQELMRGSEFTQSIVQICSLYKKEEVEITSPKNKKKGKKIEKTTRPTGRGKKHECTILMSNLNQSQPRRAQVVA